LVLDADFQHLARFPGGRDIARGAFDLLHRSPARLPAPQIVLVALFPKLSAAMLDGAPIGIGVPRWSL
jgi:hypothetical protein